MKQIEELKLERQSNIDDSKGLTEKEKKKYRNRVVFLDACIAYLEFQPKELTLSKHLEVVDRKIKSIKAPIRKLGLTKKDAAKCRAENGYKKLQVQSKTLKYLLS